MELRVGSQVATLNAGAEPAMEWVLSHMADADFAARQTGAARILKDSDSGAWSSSRAPNSSCAKGDDTRVSFSRCRGTPPVARVHGREVLRSQEPLAAPSPSPAAPAADAGAVAELASLGFSAQQCEGALRVCDGSKERAADWIFSHLDDLDQALALALGDAAAVDEPATAPAQAEPPDDGKPTRDTRALAKNTRLNLLEKSSI